MRRSAALAIVCIGLCTDFAVADGARQTLTVGDLSVVVEPRPHGMRIVYDGVEIIKHSGLVVTTPPWTPHFYLGPSEEAVAGASRERLEDVERLRLIHRGVGGSFEGVETITVHAGGWVEQVFEGRFLEPEGTALIQWRIGALNPAIITGRPYTAFLSDGETRQGVVPVVARSSDVEGSTLAKGFTAIEFDSRIGPVRIEVEANHDTIVYDYRRARWADPEDPYFWFGDLGSRFAKEDVVRYRIVYRLPPLAPPMERAGVLRARTGVSPCPRAQTWSSEGPPTIIPRPKEATFGQGGFVLRKKGAKMAPVVLAVASDDESTHKLARRAAAELQRFLQTRYDTRSVLHDGHAGPSGSAIRFDSFQPEESVPAEGYRLRVDPGGVRIQAGDARGFLHAVQTLKQLTSVGPEGDVIVRTATIRDWPSLSFRGVHLFTGGQGPELHEKLLRNVIAGLKMNHIVLEAEYVKWDSHPEIHHPEYGMSKQDVRKVLAVCDDLGIEVIPLVMSLGHCQWMFENDQHLELAEDPDAKWAYCVTNPKTYDFIFQIYDEAIELFKPRWFHIGHDEFADRGRVPYRPESKAYTVEQLLMMDTKRLHQWFSDRGVRVMMWGDMFLGEGEAPDACHAASPESAAALREELPDDVVIADWHYVSAPPAEFGSLDKFRASGHATVAATWDRPQNIVAFARAAYAKKALGLLQTTWAGYSLDPDRFAAEMHQYAAYVLAAEAAWNAENPPDPDTYPTGSYFLDLMGMSTLKPAIRDGWTADLSDACNYSLAAGDADGWFGLGAEYDLSGLPGGRARLKGVVFDLGRPSDASKPSAVVLCGKLTGNSAFPARVEFGLDQKAHQLAVLHTTNFTSPSGTKVGEYRLVYEDGEAARVDLVYGQNVFAYTDLSAAAEAPIVWSGTNAGGQRVGVRALIWENPHPEKLIRSFVAESADAAASLILIGLTGLEAAPSLE